WTAERVLSMPVEHWIERDGTRVQYWVMAPIEASSGSAPPPSDSQTRLTPPPSGRGRMQSKTVLAIHGGPAAMWGPGELSMWHEFQLLCAWGYGVVYSNPRGSGGYGYDFQRANQQDWGHGPAGDVLACLDDAMARYAWIDEDRLVVTGGSYAGYLTAWIVAHDHRFKAGLAQRGVYDLTTFFGEGNAWRLVPWAMGGYPWEEARAVLERESPFTYVDQIETPLLIMHASQDLRTGVSQSEMLYRALKVLERPVEYVRYPGAGHDLSRSGDPKQRMDRLLRIVEWFERFVGEGGAE
ncbi:MAG: alpha/beta hydrolase family protein, partial [Phycisphaerales bacterium]